jgi:hypothetical protein
MSGAEKPQHLQALDRANEVRLRYVDLKNDLREGRITLAAALEDPRADGPLTIGKLLKAKPAIGPTRMRRLLLWAGLMETIRVEHLDQTQKRRLLETVDRRDREAERERAKKQRSRMYAQRRAKEAKRRSPAAA